MGNKLLARAGKRAEGLVKGKLGALAHREKAAEHTVNVVDAGQITNAIITTTSNSNSFRILNCRIGFSKSLVYGWYSIHDITIYFTGIIRQMTFVPPKYVLDRCHYLSNLL